MDSWTVDETVNPNDIDHITTTNNDVSNEITDETIQQIEVTKPNKTIEKIETIEMN